MSRIGSAKEQQIAECIRTNKVDVAIRRSEASGSPRTHGSNSNSEIASDVGIATCNYAIGSQNS